MKKIVVVFILLSLIACSTIKLTTATQSNLDRIALQCLSCTIESLNEGKVLYAQKCVSCHRLKNPSSWTSTQWNKIVPGMVQGANKKSPGSITESQKDNILHYLMSMGKS